MYGLVGHPVAHTLSPRIHRAFAMQCGISLDYQAHDVAPADLERFLTRFVQGGGIGLNVTVPHKEAARRACESLGERARRCGAVNMLTWTGSHWHGDNSDGEGLLRDLTERHRLDLRARKVLLLGAGGAAQGVAPALLDAGIDSLWIINRDAERADALADRIGLPDRVHTRDWDDLPDLGVFDMVVQATSAARHGALPAIPPRCVGPRTLCVDLNYGEAAIPFLSWARAAGCTTVIDGLGMLVEQAAFTFAAWHGQNPETEPVHAALRADAGHFRSGD